MNTINQISRNLGRSLAVLTIASLLSLPTSVSAREQVNVARELILLNASQTLAGAEVLRVGDMVARSYPKCKNGWGTIVEPAAKTVAKPEAKPVARHDCPGCSYRFVTAGHGKAKTDKLGALSSCSNWSSAGDSKLRVHLCARVQAWCRYGFSKSHPFS